MKNIIRGGQISFHSIRMSLQLVMEMFKWTMSITVCVMIFYLFHRFDLYDLKTILVFYLAKISAGIGLEKYVFEIVDRAGSLTKIEAQSITHNIKIIILKNNFFAAIFHGLLIGVMFASVFIVVIVYFFNFRGKKIAKEKFIRGGKIVSKRKLKNLIIKSNLLNFSLDSLLRKSYNLAKVPYPKDAEFLHTIILGSTGTGKTSAILDLLDQIRKKGDRAIIYDKMGSYTATYYDPKKDIILNPLDARSKSWSFFKEIRRESDYDYIASAFIPEKKDSSGPFWTDSARRVFAVFAKKLQEEKGDVTNQEFCDALLKSNYKMIAHFLAGTEASSLISAESEKTSLSILAILAAYISSIKYLHDDPKENFSIRNWIESENNEQNGFLFISSKGDQHESLKPLISTWLDIAVKSLLSVSQNQHNSQDPRRIWIILDEVGSLQALPSLLDGLAQSRQFGGAFVISLHSISQLKAIYGRDTTDTITSLCRNKLFFAGADEETSEFCSQNLGNQEVEEMKEGISYGANEIRDGVNLNKHRSVKRLVMSSQFMFLKKLYAYVKFAGEFPISKISFEIKHREKSSCGFIERETKQEIVPIIEIVEEAKTGSKAKKSAGRKKRKKPLEIDSDSLGLEKVRGVEVAEEIFQGEQPELPFEYKMKPAKSKDFESGDENKEFSSFENDVKDSEDAIAQEEPEIFENKAVLESKKRPKRRSSFYQ